MKTLKSYRDQARESLKNNWWKAIGAYLLLSLVINIPSFITELYSTLEIEAPWTSIVLNVLTILLVPFSLGYTLSLLTHTRPGEGNFLKNSFEHTRDRYGALMGLLWLMILIFMVAVGIVAGAIGAIYSLEFNIILKYLLIAVLAVVGLVIYFKLAYGYRMAAYLLHDDTSLTALKALKKSAEMMQGKKRVLLMLDLSILHWLFYPSILIVIAALLIENTLGSSEAVGVLIAVIAAPIVLALLGLSFVLNAYSTAATAHFYEDLKAETYGEDDVEEEAVEAVEEAEAEEVETEEVHTED